MALNASTTSLKREPLQLPAQGHDRAIRRQSGRDPGDVQQPARTEAHGRDSRTHAGGGLADMSRHLQLA
jgi:hypothetical protein